MSHSVSVIISLHDCAHAISSLLLSLLAQELKELEIIVVDDGASGNPVDLVEEYCKQYPSITLCRAACDTSSQARSIGLQRATGEYVVLPDADGWVPPKAYSLMYQAAKEKAADVIIARTLVQGNGGKWEPSAVSVDAAALRGEANLAKDFTMPVLDPTCCNKMIRRGLLEEHSIDFPKAKAAANLAFSVSVFEHAASVYLLDTVAYLRPATGKSLAPGCAQRPELVQDGLGVLKDLGLRLHHAGQVDAQALLLEYSFRFVFERFCQLPAGVEKNQIFEDIKDYLSLYRGLKEYRIVIESIMGMELETLLTLPCPTYVRQKQMLVAAPAPGPTTPARPAVANIADAPGAVLRMYENGQIGLRFVFWCCKAWLKYKLKRHKK